MTTIRRRLTFWYTVALGVTVVAFGSLLYLERRQSACGSWTSGSLLEAELADRWLTESYKVLGRIVTTDRSQPGARPRHQRLPRGGPRLSDRGGHRRPGAGAVRGGPRPQRADARAADRAARHPPHPPSVRQCSRRGPSGRVRYLAIRIADAGPAGGRRDGGHADRPRPRSGRRICSARCCSSRRSCSSGAGIVGYWLAGTSLRPVQGIMDELEAITDGRSLHRRLAVPLSGDEMARLALDGERHAGPAGAELRQPAPLHRRREPRAQDPADGASGRRGARPGPSRRRRTEMLQSLDETLAQINQMSEMVENLLTLARADEGRAPLAVEVADLRDMLGDVAETAGMLGETSGIAVRTEMPEAPVRLAVDRHRIREMLLNLVTNAIKYTAQGGTVGLRLWRGRAGRGLRRVATRASASPPATCPTSSSGSGGPTRPARAPAIGRAPGWGWPSPNGSPRRMADPSRCRAGRGGGRSSPFGCRRPAGMRRSDARAMRAGRGGAGMAGFRLRSIALCVGQLRLIRVPHRGLIGVGRTDSFPQQRTVPAVGSGSVSGPR